MDYEVILFKNKTQQKIIKKFKTFKRSVEFYEDYLKQHESVVFDKQFENGRYVKYELLLVELSSNKLIPIYLTDDMGRNIQVKLDNPDLSVVRISHINLPELIYDVNREEKIDYSTFYRRYIQSESVKLVSQLNNKVVVQEDDNYTLLSLKSVEESNRFLECLSNDILSKKKLNCIIVQDYSTAQRKYLYSVLESKGFDKKVLYRKFTTHPRRHLPAKGK